MKEDFFNKIANFLKEYWYIILALLFLSLFSETIRTLIIGSLMFIIIGFTILLIGAFIYFDIVKKGSNKIAISFKNLKETSLPSSKKNKDLSQWSEQDVRDVVSYWGSILDRSRKLKNNELLNFNNFYNPDKCLEYSVREIKHSLLYTAAYLCRGDQYLFNCCAGGYMFLCNFMKKNVAVKVESPDTELEKIMKNRSANPEHNEKFFQSIAKIKGLENNTLGIEKLNYMKNLDIEFKQTLKKIKNK